MVHGNTEQQLHQWDSVADYLLGTRQRFHICMYNVYIHCTKVIHLSYISIF